MGESTIVLTDVHKAEALAEGDLTNHICIALVAIGAYAEIRNGTAYQKRTAVKPVAADEPVSSI